MPLSPYDTDLDRNPANFQPLSPLPFLERAASVFPNHTAVIHGPLKRSYAELYARTRRLASALKQHGIGKNDTVAAMLPNTPAMLECHYGVPMCGAVLNTLNTRLDAAIIAFSLDHGEAKVLIADREFSGTVKEALALCKVKPLVIDYDDPVYDGPGERLGSIEYEDFLKQGDPDFDWLMPSDEWDAIALNYTSGTTGDPKGVVYHHRGANLLATSNVLTGGMGRHPVYLWTLPMFHCNGWCFPWTISLQAGTHVCLRQVRAKAMYDADRRPWRHPYVRRADRDVDAAQRARCREAAASPEGQLLHRRRAAAGGGARRHGAGRLQRHHLYGLTECYGPAVVNEWQR
jgi:fatty-acyl-CoA synthase